MREPRRLLDLAFEARDAVRTEPFGRQQLDRRRPPETDPKRLKRLRKGKATVVAFYGGKDEGIPAAKVKAFEDGLKKAKVPAEVRVYPDAGHAFMNDARPSYDKAAAAEAWGKLLAALRDRLQ